METKLEQIAAKAVKQRPKSVVREIRTPRSVGTGGGRPPPVTRWAPSNGCPYRKSIGPHAQFGPVTKIGLEASPSALTIVETLFTAGTGWSNRPRLDQNVRSSQKGSGEPPVGLAGVRLTLGSASTAL